MTAQNELLLWAALAAVSGVGPQRLRELLAAFGTPAEVFRQPQAGLAQVVPPEVAKAIAAGPDRALLERTAGWLAEPGSRLLTEHCAEYPHTVKELPGAPALLYVKGDVALLGTPAIAIVGSRNATPQGISNAEAFARELSGAGLCVVSGLALGIDAAAHRGGLAGIGRSIAVLGTGVDVVYPARHRALAHQLAERGALVSEFALGTASIAVNFPRRNRIISGLSLGCLVVEAALQSGSLITARLAAEQGKEVFAIPGSIHSPLSKGCHSLIKQGAKLAETSRDILEELAPQLISVSSAGAAASDNKPAPPLLEHLGFDPVHPDVIATRSGLTAENVSAMLLALELEGRVAALPGGLYQRLD